MRKMKEKLMLDENLLKNLFYNTFVRLLMTEQNEMIQDIEAEVHHETYNKDKNSQTRCRSTSRD